MTAELEATDKRAKNNAVFIELQYIRASEPLLLS